MRGQVVQRESGGLVEGHIVGDREGALARGSDVLREAGQHGERGHPVTRSQRRSLRRHHDLAAHLAARHERQVGLQLVLAPALQQLGERHTR